MELTGGYLEEKITAMDKLLNDPELKQLALDEQTGDDFEIKLGRKQIRLIPVGGEDED